MWNRFHRARNIPTCRKTGRNHFEASHGAQSPIPLQQSCAPEGSRAIRFTPRMFSMSADRMEAALKHNPQTDPITVDGFEIKRIDDFPDVSLFTTGPGGALNPDRNRPNPFSTLVAPDYARNLHPRFTRRFPRVQLWVQWGLPYFFSSFSFRCFAHASAVVWSPCKVFFLFTA